MRLYEIANNYNNLLELLEDESIDNTIVNEALAKVEGNLSFKMDNTCKIIKNIESDIKGFKEEEKRLSERRKSLENKQANLKAYIYDTMIATGHKDIKGGIFTLKIQKNPVSVEIESLDDIPDMYKSFKVEADKRSIIELLKKGESIPGAKLKQSEGLRIR